jgi:ferredoxin
VSPVRVRVDFGLCQGHGTCVEEAPAVFGLDEKKHLVVILQEEPPESERENVKRAVKYCPTLAIKLED